MISIVRLICFFIILTPMVCQGQILLQKYSISTYTNTNYIDNTPGDLAETNRVSDNYLSVIRVGFRQYTNPNINSSSTLSLDNRLTLMDAQDALVYGDILFYPNPFNLKSGAILTYVLNNTVDVNIQIYDMFGHKVYQRFLVRGMDGAKMGTNKLNFNQYVFENFDAPAGIYFIFLFDEYNQLIGKTKFAIVP
jgi:hypothetical protein